MIPVISFFEETSAAFGNRPLSFFRCGPLMPAARPWIGIGLAAND